MTKKKDPLRENEEVLEDSDGPDLEEDRPRNRAAGDDPRWILPRDFLQGNAANNGAHWAPAPVLPPDLHDPQGFEIERFRAENGDMFERRVNRDNPGRWILVGNLRNNGR